MRFMGSSLSLLANILGNLELQADAGLKEIAVHGVEAGVLEEAHQARVELLDNVVEVHFRGFLLIARVPYQRSYKPIGELGPRVLAENLELADADLFGNEEGSKQIGPFALDIVRVISAEPVVTGKLALDREGPAAPHLPLHEEVASGGRLIGLHLSCHA